MDLIKREFKNSLKSFTIWMVVTALLVFISIIKFQGIGDANSDAITELLNYYPPIILALFGMAPGVDLGTLSGYMSIVAYYAMICGGLYGIRLGAGVVTREIVDGTYEFLFTKPISRSKVLFRKLMVGKCYILIFSILTFGFMVASVLCLESSELPFKELLLYGIGILLVSYVFYAISFLVATCIRKSEKSVMIANGIFMGSFLIGAVYDVLEEAEWLRPFAILRYFLYEEIKVGTLNVVYMVLCLIIVVTAIGLGLVLYNRKDLQN